MSRFFSILAVSVILGAMAALLLPQWQTRLVTKGQVVTIDQWESGVDLLVEVKEEKNQYYIVNEKLAKELVATSEVTCAQGGKVTEVKCEVAPKEIEWTTGSKNNKTRHIAPGANIRLQAKVEIPGTNVAEVKWGGEALRKLATDGNLVVKGGGAEPLENGLLLARYPVHQDSTARTAALARGAFEGGLPLATVLVVIGMCFFGFPKAAGPAAAGGAGREGTLPPGQFEAGYGGCRMHMGIWGGIVAMVAVLFGLVSLISERALVDVVAALDRCLWAGLIGMVMLMLVAWLLSLRPRTVLTDAQGIEVKAALSGKTKFRAAWQELTLVKRVERMFKGQVAAEWVEMCDGKGGKVKVSKTQVRGYPEMAELILQRAPKHAVEAGLR